MKKEITIKTTEILGLTEKKESHSRRGAKVTRDSREDRGDTRVVRRGMRETERRVGKRGKLEQETEDRCMEW